MPRITLVIHNMPYPQRAELASPPKPVLNDQPACAKTTHDVYRSGRHRLNDSTWPAALEQVLHSWPITLRLALLVAIVLTGTAAVAATLGIGGQLLLAGLSLRGRRSHRRRVTALRLQTKRDEAMR